MRNAIVAAILIAGMAACATTPSDRARVVSAAPPVSDFAFDTTPPLTEARAFVPWIEVTAANTSEQDDLESCLADREQCANGHLLRYRRLLEIAAELPQTNQLKLVQEYFNAIDQQLQPRGDDDWASLYQVASTSEGDCKAIALSKYFTLRRLGWEPDDLRIVMNWDDTVGDWHALLAARLDNETYVLDVILGLQEPRDFRSSYMVYSISEMGIWDHAPDFVPSL